MSETADYPVMAAPPAGHNAKKRPGRLQAKNVVLENIDKSFGSVRVVKDLNLSVGAGEFLVLLGPSGCGKTTALRMIAGLEEANEGKITIGDVDVTNTLPKYRDVAMVFQSYALYPHKTVAENIAFPLRARGIPKSERAGAIRTAAEQVHMQDYLDRYPRQLSGGQRQRVALARAIVRRPSVFLMDEPLSNLDAKLRGFMRAELKHLQHDLGVTMIYVTHDQIEAMTLAHRVVVMNHGVLQQIGTPREVYDQPRNLFVAGFMGAPPMNFIHGAIANNRFESHGVSLPLQGDTEPRKAVLGFRPEDALITETGRGLFDTTVYTAELTGDVTLVTISLGKASLAVKMPKDYDADYDTAVALTFPHAKGFLFDEATGERLKTELQTIT